MRPYWVLLPLFGALVSSADAGGQRLARRQDDSSSTPTSDESETTETTSTEETTETSTTDDDTETSTTNDDTETTTTTDADDVTVTVTRTVSGDGETVSSRVTRTVTSTTVIIDISTERETTTVTSRDQDTATKTVYTTTTVFGNQKRDTWLLENLPAEPADAVPLITPAPSLDIDSYDAYNAEMLKRDAHPGPNVFKRDTITETETVTEGGGDTTVVETVTRTVVTATTSERTERETITETEQADAKTTVTTTKTFTVTSNTMTTDIFTEPLPSTTGQPAETNGSNSDGNDDGGLSTGAKAGIGAGAGVVGLALIAGLAWFFLKKRHRGPKHDNDDLFGASEVPVGAAAGGGGSGGAAARPMSHHPSTSTSYAPTRSPILPNVAPEGYRGTAMGDGRTGYAKPEPYGAAYTRPSAQYPAAAPVSPVSPPTTGYSHPSNRADAFGGGGGGGVGGHGADYLPEHHTPADMNGVGGYGGRALSPSPGPQAAELGHDGHTAKWQAPGATEVDNTPAGYHHGNLAPSDVYEMPAHDHR